LHEMKIAWLWTGSSAVNLLKNINFYSEMGFIAIMIFNSRLHEK
jgi:hypothetical protein